MAGKFFLHSALMGAGLAMDAVSVSVADALREPKMSRRRIAVIAGVYACFQALMPLAGWALVRTAARRLWWFQRWTARIGGGLLVWIGWTLLRDGLADAADGQGEERDAERVRPGTLLLQGLATSIDALSVGFTIADSSPPRALAAAGIIAAVTFCLCAAGMGIGRRAGIWLSRRAPAAGGGILLALGTEILRRALA